MLAAGISGLKREVGLVGISQIRHNWARWAGHTTQTWLELPDDTFSQRLERVSQIKRFLEKYCVDPTFRADLVNNPQQTLSDHAMKVDVADVRSLWDSTWDPNMAANQPISDAVNQFLDFSQEWMDWAELRQIGGCSKHPLFSAWRDRQIARTQFQLSDALSQRLAHIPVCFELSQGCSVGCYFCGISAAKLQGVFRYTPENAKLWRGILTLLQEILGEAASAGFCYWATDPLDNPDYEQFMIDFHDILGVFPQTTTAQPTKDLNRVRSLLKLSFEKGCKLNRFSILSAKILDQVYAEFTAEELAFVGLVPQNPDAQVLTRFPFAAAPARKMRAGRLLQGRSSQQESKQANHAVDGTIACVSGFLINLVERSIKLISPCNASPDYPLGYITFDQGTFSDIHSCKTLINQLIERNMSLSVLPQQPIRFQQELQYRPLLDGFQVSTPWKTIAVRHLLAIPGTLNRLQLGQAIYAGKHTANEIVDLFAHQGVSPESTLNALNGLLQQGILQESIHSPLHF